MDPKGLYTLERKFDCGVGRVSYWESVPEGVVDGWVGDASACVASLTAVLSLCPGTSLLALDTSCILRPRPDLRTGAEGIFMPGTKARRYRRYHYPPGLTPASRNARCPTPAQLAAIPAGAKLIRAHRDYTGLYRCGWGQCNGTLIPDGQDPWVWSCVNCAREYLVLGDKDWPVYAEDFYRLTQKGAFA